jgi:uncharacterized protein YecT (DUF1311 family)
MTRAALIIAIHLVLASTPAAAQTTEDMDAVQACLMAADKRRTEANAASNDTENPKAGPDAHLDAAAALAKSAAESCIGFVADPCMQTDEGSSTYGMLACIGRELEVWDKRLNAAYKDAISPPGDEGLDEKAAEVVKQQYRTIQRSWIPWRDATCEVLHSDGIPIYGSQSKVDGAYCNMRLTAKQALWLEGSAPLGLEN